MPLIVLGDDITTDHISPAGSIPAKGEAGKWLIERVRTRTTSTSSPRAAATSRPWSAACSPTARSATCSPRGPAGLDRSCTIGRAVAFVSCGRALPRRGRADNHRRRAALRGRVVARLGRQGHGSPGRACGAGQQLRADPPFQPDRHGRPAPGAAEGRASSSHARAAARRPVRASPSTWRSSSPSARIEVRLRRRSGEDVEHHHAAARRDLARLHHPGSRRPDPAGAGASPATAPRHHHRPRTDGTAATSSTRNPSYEVSMTIDLDVFVRLLAATALGAWP